MISVVELLLNKAEVHQKLLAIINSTAYNKATICLSEICVKH